MSKLDKEGYQWIRNALSEKDIFDLETNISWSSLSGTRDITLLATLKEKLTQLAEPFMPQAKIVRLTAFNKTLENNWALPWHQDRIIVSRKRLENSKFKNWTRKDNYWHCEPPIEYIENMLFARMYLDSAGADSGDIQLAKGSHKFSKVLHSSLETVLSRCPSIECSGKTGDVLLVKALTLHKSQKNQTSKPRRTVRIDFSNDEEICDLTNP